MILHSVIKSIVLCFSITNIYQLQANTNNEDLANVSSQAALAYTIPQRKETRHVDQPNMRSLIKHPRFYGLKRKEAKLEVRRNQNNMEHPLMGVIVIGSIFFFITMCISAMVLVFYRKRNTVFVFHKSNQQLENDMIAADNAEESNYYNDDLEEWAAQLSFNSSSNTSLNDLDLHKSICQPFYYGVTFSNRQCSLTPPRQAKINKNGVSLKSVSQSVRRGGYSKIQTTKQVESADCAAIKADVITTLTLPTKTQSTITIAQSGQVKPLENLISSDAQRAQFSSAMFRNIRIEDNKEEGEETLGEVLTALLSPIETESLSSSRNSMTWHSTDGYGISSILPRSQSDNLETSAKATQRLPLKHLQSLKMSNK